MNNKRERNIKLRKVSMLKVDKNFKEEQINRGILLLIYGTNSFSLDNLQLECLNTNYYFFLGAYFLTKPNVSLLYNLWKNLKSKLISMNTAILI